MKQFTPHPKNPTILVGNTYKLKNLVTEYSWQDKRSEAEIQEDIQARAHTKEQIQLDHLLRSPDNYMGRKQAKVEPVEA